jgi:hypothetical protein
MNWAYIDWWGPVVTFALLGWVACNFTRRTYRLTVAVTAIAGLFAVLGYGLSLGGHPRDFLHALIRGGDEIVRQIVSPLIPAGLRPSVVPGLPGWLLLLLLAGGLLVIFDTICTHREPPVVTVGSVPAGDPSDPGLRARTRITEELKFRLPAVAVRAPAAMPGGSALVSLATVVSESGFQGSKLAAALMQVVHALEARPRTYEAQLFVDRCQSDRAADPRARQVQVTVKLQDARNGTTLASRVLRPCPEQDAADVAAGFTARQVFLRDISTPAWAAGSFDGEDLSAYLLSRKMRPAGPTYQDFQQCRRSQRARLAEAVCRSTNAGLVQYELASLDDLDGDHVASLRRHLDNRLHNPRFLSARYRLAVTLSALGDQGFERWPRAGAGQQVADLHREILLQLWWSGLPRELSRRQLRKLRLPASDELLIELLGAKQPGDGGRLPVRTERQLKQVLQLLARRELRRYRRRMRWLPLAAFCWRPQRSAYLEQLRGGTRRLHLRRRMLASWVARQVVNQRLVLLSQPPERALRSLRAAQAKVRRRLRLGRVLDQGHAWSYGKLPWQAVYNAAALYALAVDDNGPGAADAAYAVRLLRLAISDPACELDRPSEWISTDPSLRTLRGTGVFRDLVREQASYDFAAAPNNDCCADPWLRQLLPALEQGPEELIPGPRGPLAGRRILRSPLPAEITWQAVMRERNAHPHLAGAGRGACRLGLVRRDDRRVRRRAPRPSADRGPGGRERRGAAAAGGRGHLRPASRRGDPARVASAVAVHRCPACRAAGRAGRRRGLGAGVQLRVLPARPGGIRARGARGPAGRGRRGGGRELPVRASRRR